MTIRARDAVPFVFVLATLMFTAARAAETEEGRERSTALTAKVGLMQAIQTAEMKTNGKAVSAETHYRDGKASYEVMTIVDSERRKVMLDPSTGNVMSVESESGHRDDATIVAGALAKAVTSAEKAAGTGKGLEAEYTDQGTRIQVLIARTPDSVQTIDIDPLDDRVVKLDDVEHRATPKERY